MRVATRRLRFTVAVAGGLICAGTVLPATAAARASGAGPVDAEHLLEPEDRRPREEPSVAVDPADPRHVVVAAMQFARSYDALFVSGYSPRARVWASTTGGRAYRALAELPTQPGAGAVTTDPRLVWSRDGALFAVYTSAAKEYSKTPDPADGLYLARSTDGGRHWQRRARVAGRACGAPSLPLVALDPRRHGVYVAWTQSVEPKCDGADDLSKAQLRLARSTDGGEHFSAPVVVTDGGLGRSPGLAVAPDGTVLVSYVTGGTVSVGDPDCPGAQESVEVRRLSPTGRLIGVARPVPVECIAYGGLFGNGAAFEPVFDPVMSVDPDTGAVLLATCFQNYTQSGLVTATSLDAGRSWRQTVVTGGPGTAASMPSLAAVARGKLAMAWLEVSGGGIYQPVLAFTADDGATWGPAVPLATLPSQGNTHPQTGYDPHGFGKYLGLAVGRDGRVHAAWPDLRPQPDAGNGNVDIWTRDLASD